MKKKRILDDIELVTYDHEHRLINLTKRIESLEARNKEHDDMVWQDIMDLSPEQQAELLQIAKEELKRRGLDEL